MNNAKNGILNRKKKFKMKKLFKVSCSESAYNESIFSDIYVIAESYDEASNKAIAKLVELRYNLVDAYVSSIELIADEKQSNKKLLVI